MSNVVDIGPRLVGDGVTLQPESVLEAAKGRLESVVVIGVQPDGEMYVAGTAGVAESFFLIARAQHWFIENEVLRNI